MEVTHKMTNSSYLICRAAIKPSGAEGKRVVIARMSPHEAKLYGLRVSGRETGQPSGAAEKHGEHFFATLAHTS